jgi:hypothetical protein
VNENREAGILTLKEIRTIPFNPDHLEKNLDRQYDALFAERHRVYDRNEERRDSGTDDGVRLMIPSIHVAASWDRKYGDVRPKHNSKFAHVPLRPPIHDLLNDSTES